MTQFKAMKFRVESPEHSAKIQKKLFKMGYKWWDGPILRNLNATFLFADEEGGLGWEDDPEHFESEKVKKYQEMQLVEVTTYDFVPVPKKLSEHELARIYAVIGKATASVDCTLALNALFKKETEQEKRIRELKETIAKAQQQIEELEKIDAE